jgi:hypothetical protein
VIDEDLYVLCRPRGGLNDSLCQVERCWRYAEEKGRTLLVEASRSCFFGEFSTFFSPLVESAAVRFSLNGFSLDDESVMPADLSGRVSSYQAGYSAERENWIDSQSGVLLTFDFSKNHEERVLVHDQCGGGTLSFALLERVRLSRELGEVVRARLARLGKPYLAVHVRNTDYKTDYSALFDTIYPDARGRRLLVCSDDVTVISNARRFFDRSDVLSSSDIPDTEGKPLHSEWTMRDTGERKQMAINSIVDLCALASAEKLYFTSVSKGYPSGFSGLAAHLHQNKSCLERLLGEG